MNQTNGPLLVVDDDPGIQRQLRWSFDDRRVVTASDRAGALELVRRERPPVVILDLGLPPDPHGPEEGLRTLKEILTTAPRAKVIVATGNSHRSTAVRAIGLGAYDFCPKPIDPEVLGLIVDRAYYIHDLESEVWSYREQRSNTALDAIITTSPVMLSVCRMIERAAPANVNVLLLGESGTGKELLARAVHRLSPRSNKPLVVINCAAIPENLLESELFGYEAGAFTGAVKQTLGRLELAQGGTLFLDEIGDMPKPLQAKLLRFLQDRIIERVGGRKSIALDIRVVSATNRNLDDAIAAGEFREDLYFRLGEIVVEIPPLRHRDDDVVVLAHSFIARFSREHGRPLAGFAPDALAAIAAYAWPGNVREMENRIKRAVIMAEGGRVTAADLSLPTSDQPVPEISLRKIRERAESRAINQAILLSHGNISRAAKILGVSRPTLYGLLKQYGLQSCGDPVEASDATD